MFKQASLVVAMLCGIAMPSQANILHKDMKIMASIMDTALKETTSEQGLRYHSADYTYLAGQGVVFDIKLGSSRWMLDKGLVILDDILPQTPPVPDVPFLDNEEFAQVYNEAIDRARYALSEMREEVHSVRQESREIEWEIRELERRKRDTEFELRHADEKRKATLKQNMQELEQELRTLQQVQAELMEKAKNVEARRKQEIESKRQSARKQQSVFLSGFESTMGDILCKYSAGLRGLDKEEYVSFVLNPMSDPEDAARDQRVYVFSMQDVNACLSGRIDAKALLNKAQAYYF